MCVFTREYTYTHKYICDVQTADPVFRIHNKHMRTQYIHAHIHMHKKMHMHSVTHTYTHIYICICKSACSQSTYKNAKGEDRLKIYHERDPLRLSDLNSDCIANIIEFRDSAAHEFLRARYVCVRIYAYIRVCMHICVNGIP
jgi:hypothetical protein